MNTFLSVPVTNRNTGVTFGFRVYAGSPGEAAELARLTFNRPALWDVKEPSETTLLRQTEIKESSPNPQPAMTEIKPALPDEPPKLPARPAPFKSKSAAAQTELLL